MDDTQFRAILAEMKESNKLMKAMISELSQIKFELVNERITRDVTYKIKIPEPMPEALKEIPQASSIWRLFGFYKEKEEKGEYDTELKHL